MLPISPPTNAKSKDSSSSKNKFNFCSKPLNFSQTSLQALNSPQLTVLSLQISEQGKSGGVIFLQTSLGSIVLKPNSIAPTDFFFNELALSLDVNVPIVHAIGCYEPVFQKLVYAVEKYCCDDEVLYARIRSKLDFPFYQVIEYIPAISLANTGSEKFKKFLLRDEKMYQLGICLSFDLFINNSDRFNLVWRGQGNINNILIEIPAELRPLQLEKSKEREDLSIQLNNYIFIDHDGHMIDQTESIAKENVEKYMNKVMEFQLNMIMFLRGEYSVMPDQMDKLTKQLEFFTQYRLTEAELILVCEGIIFGTHNVIKMYENKEIHDLYHSLHKPITKVKKENYWNDYWNRQIKDIHLSFAETYYVKVSAIYTTYPELINAIVDKVKAKMDQCGKNRRKRVSILKSQQNSQRSQAMSRKGVNGEKGENGSGEGNEMKENGGEDGIGEESDMKRRWREKLEIFKKENYK